MVAAPSLPERLLSAKLSERPLTFYWGNLNACSVKNPVYKSPEYMVMY